MSTSMYLNKDLWEGKIYFRHSVNGTIYNLNAPIWIDGSIDSNNNVISTEVESGIGAVAEFTGRSPYSFSLSGIYVDEKDIGLSTFISLIKRLAEIKAPLKITHNELNEGFKIYQMVILDYSFELFSSYMTFNFSCEEYSQEYYIGLDFSDTDEQEVANAWADSTDDDIPDEINSLGEILGGGG